MQSMAKIQLFIAGELQGQYILDDRQETKVGRSARCDIVLPNADVSRHHCTFRHSRGQWAVIDANSSNGTYVNGETIRERVLRHTDRVIVGKHTLLFDQYGAVNDEDGRADDADGTQAPGVVLLQREDLLNLLERSQKSQARALVLAGDYREVVPLLKDTTVIGSGWDCDLRISGLLVKPHQALVVKTEQGHS
ncbi:MAG: FHA domain-containing protein, partial [Candidatus Methylumidiphilus sp.]